MSLSIEIKEIEKQTFTQVEGIEISLRAISALFTKLRAVQSLRKSQLQMAEFPNTLDFLTGGLWQRLEAVIAELESDRSKFCSALQPRLTKLIDRVDRELTKGGSVEGSENLQNIFGVFEKIKDFKIPYLNEDNFEDVLGKISFTV